jgi:hypothetical protein
MNLQFGTGTLLAFNTGAGASGDAGHTPVTFGGLQDVEIDMDGSVKELHGQNQFPIAVARGKMKITGKAKFADLNAKAYNELFWGQTLSAGQVLLALNETAAPTSGKTYTVTHGSKFSTDYGCRDATTGVPLIKMLTASSVAASTEYNVKSSTGVYTFNSSAPNATISYAYTASSAGYHMTASNQLQGYTPVFQVALQQTFMSKTYSIQLLQCVSSKLTNPTKMEDYTISDFEFAAFANAAGNLFTQSWPE